MNRPRIGLDTNALISAAVKPQGRQAQVVNLVAFRAVELFVSEAVLAEYREVFSRSRSLPGFLPPRLRPCWL